jgi:beta-phosphoglucomutase-like phosphatase (HAD superfamily)
MMFRAAIFDMDGTLIDSERVIQGAWIDAARALGLALHEDAYAAVIGLNENESNAILKSLLGGEEAFLAVRSGARRLLTLGAEGVVFPLKSGGAQILSMLRLRNIPCAVASSSTVQEIEERLSRVGVRHHFDALAGGNEVPRGKPDPAVYLLAARRLGVPISACLVFEDSAYGAMAAIAAGAEVVLIPDMRTPSPELSDRLLCVLTDLNDAVVDIPRWFGENAAAKQSS